MALALPVEAELNAAMTGYTTQPLPQTPVVEYFADLQARLSNANTGLQAAQPWTVSGSERVALLLPYVRALLHIMELLRPVLPAKIAELTGILGWDGTALHLTRNKFRAFAPL